MIKKQHIQLICGLLLFFSLVSCASNAPAKANKIKPPEDKAKQGKATRHLAEAYMKGGNYTSALRELLGPTADHSDPLTQNDLGLTYMAKKRLDLAEQHFRKAIELKPDFAGASNNLATVYMAQQKWSQAISILRGVLADMLYATPHLAYHNLGWAYFNTGQYKLAEESYKAALADQPKHVMSMQGLSKVYITTGRLSQAVNLLNKALKISPGFIPLYLDTAKAYQMAGHHKEALIIYRKVMALAPDTEFAEQAQKAAGSLMINNGG